MTRCQQLWADFWNTGYSYPGGYYVALLKRKIKGLKHG